MSIETPFLEYLFHHVIYPPKLPQRPEEDDGGWRLDRKLLLFTREVFTSFVAKSLSRSRDSLKVVTNMMDTWISVDSGHSISEESLAQVIANLKTHGATALYLRAQNCGWVAYHDRKHDGIIIDAFEASPTSEAVLAAQGPLIRSFPGQSVAIPSRMVSDRTFCSYLSNALTRLSAKEVDEMLPESSKAGRNVPEIRDTTHPGLVTEGLMTQLLAFGKHNNWPSFEKHMRDDVNWGNCLLPWRRSPQWVVLRVALQTVLQRVFPDHEGHTQYKNFMLYLASGIGTLMAKHAAHPDQLAIVRSKIGRRIYKLGDKAYDFVTSHAQLSEKGIMDDLRTIQRSIKEANHMVVPHFPVAGEDDLQMSLKHCREYLQSVLQQTPVNIEPIPFNRLHGQRNQRDSYGLPILGSADILVLADFERWVEEHLAVWVHNVNPSDDICCSLARLLQQYADFATTEYVDCPDDISLMALVVLELWMAIDTTCVALCPLLKEYPPEIPVEFLEPLLLPQRSQMKRANQVEKYIRSRYADSINRLPVILGDPKPENFAVRYFNGSEKHKLLRQQIEQYATRQVDERRRLWCEESKRYQGLIDRAANMSCQYVYYSWGGSGHSPSCEKCSLKCTASNMVIEVYEWPLPKNEHVLKNVVFELDCPPWFTSWRDVTWKILHGLGRYKETKAENMEQNLLGYSEIQKFCVNRDQSLTLGSQTKSWLKAHYRERSFPVNFEELCVPNGFQFKLFDRSKHAWVSEQTESPTLKSRCTLAVPPGPYSGLQYAVDSFRHTENKAVADQRNCHLKLSLHEFLAFSCLRAGERTQWYNIMRELASSDLSMDEESVGVLFQQAVWELGSYNSKSELRNAHQIFQDPACSGRLIETLEMKLDTIESNWKENYALHTLVILALRVLTLSEGFSMIDRVASFLRKTRQVAMTWCQTLAEGLDSQTGGDSETQQMLIFEIARTCLFTYAVEAKHLPAFFHNREDLRALIWSSMAMHDNTPKSSNKKSKAILRRARKLLHYVELRARQLIVEDESGLNDAIRSVVPNIQISSTWRFCEGDLSRWVTNKTLATLRGRQLEIHYDLLSGELLVDNCPPGRLPSTYTQVPLFQRLFSSRMIRVIPSDLPGSAFMSAQPFNDFQVHFGIDDQKLVVKAQDKNRLLQLIPHSQLKQDFPVKLTEDYAHWLDLESGILEFRPLQQAWRPRQGNWHLTFNLLGQSLMRRGKRTLVDLHGPLFKQVASVLGTLDAPEHIHVTQLKCGTIEVDMIRLRLRFFINDSGALESQEHNATVDQNQDLGCLYGLKNKLVLTDANCKGRRTVLIPYGQVALEKTPQHMHVAIILPNSARIKYFSYSLDPHLQALLDSSGMLGSLYLAYLHAVTSFVLPDPASNRSGTDVSLRILRQARMKSTTPLDAEEFTLLKQIADLTPRRAYYPPHLKVMQIPSWNAHLGEMAQHDDFWPVIYEIVTHNQRFSEFFRVMGAKPVDTEVSLRNIHLLKRAHLRHAQFRCSEFGGSIGNQIAKRTMYAARDRGNQSDRSCRVYEVAALVRNWSVSVGECHDLVDHTTTWKHVYTCRPGFEGDPYTSLLKIPIEDIWGALYNLCRTSNRESDSYRLISIFCIIAFGKEIGLEDIRPLLAVAFSGRFRDISVPGNPMPERDPMLMLHMGKQLDKLKIRMTIEKHYTPFDILHPSSTGVFLSKESAERRRKLEEDYEKQKTRDIDSCCDMISRQWPCERPTLHESISHHLSRRGILDDCGNLFTFWYRNRQFLTFIRQVQDRLTAIFARDSFVEAMPLPPVHGSIRTDPPFQPPTCLKMMHSTKPIIHLSESSEFACFRRRIPQGRYSDRNLELRTLIQSSFETSNTHHSDYQQDLLRSLNALEAVQLPENTHIPIQRQVLIDYYTRIREERDVTWSNLVSALTTTNHVWEAVGGATLWPAVTVSSLLSFLADRWSEVPEQWKQALLMLARIISSLRRCDRLLTCFDKNDKNGFFKEAESTDCENWEMSQRPDWFLFEIENNLTIRSQQAEIAQRMIDPGSLGNSVSQLNMGEGKTSVITPLVASVLSNGSCMTRIIIPRPLLRQSLHFLSQRLGGLMNRLVYYIPFSRDTPIEKSTVDLLWSIYRCCKHQKGILIALPEQILSFRLVGLDMMGMSGDIISEPIRLEQWMQSNCRNIIDESDEVLDPKFQLVYTVGNQQSMDGHSNRWEIIQAVLAIVEAQAIRLHSRGPKYLGLECSGARYPILHFLRTDAIDVLLDTVYATIRDNGLSGLLSFHQLGPRVRKIALQFIIRIDLADDDRLILREALSNSAIMRKLLVLRGLLAYRILRFTLAGKRWLVDYGLHPSRCLIAVPFRAKGVPCEKAEFGHPDVALTLTCLSYYYEGLKEDQVRHCFSILVKQNDPTAEYCNWVARRLDELPSGLRSLSGVNLDDTQIFRTKLYPHLRYQKGIIDFYLSSVVFPKEAKEFPYKLSTSAWDLPSLPNLPPTTGFSGTNDNRSLLPRSIPQRDLPHLHHTNAMVLSQLLLEENRQCVRAEDSKGHQLRTNELLRLINSQEPPISVIIDIGAQILERSNQIVALYWLSIVPESRADSAVFFDHHDEAMVIDREGHTERLLASPFRRRMERCLIFLDQYHTRGVDFKLPLHYRAAVILGPRLTKDRLVQACNRMRELGNGQSVAFFIPPEVSHSMPPGDGHLTSREVIQWTLKQTCDNLENLRPLWVWQGLNFHRRLRLWNELVTKEDMSRDIALEMQEQEARTLLQLYAPWETETQTSLLDMYGLNQSDPVVRDLLQIWRAIGDGTRNFWFHEEQERELAAEVEREQQVDRPRLMKPLDHSVHPDIWHFVKHGKFPDKGSSICRAFEGLRNTSANQLYFPSNIGPHLYTTLDFVRSVQRTTDLHDDEFLKSVRWILSNRYNENLLILSQFEVDQLLPDIQASENTSLHIYTPRATKRVRPFHRLDFLSVGKCTAHVPPSLEIAQDLELFAGSLYFETFADYERFHYFLGLITDRFSNVPEDAISPEGFVNEETRQEVGWPVQSPFRSNPLLFISAIFNIRGKGRGYMQTHIGSIVGGVPLSKDRFE